MKNAIVLILIALSLTPIAACGRHADESPETAAQAPAASVAPVGGQAQADAPAARFEALAAHPEAPTDIIRWKGKILATELSNNRLAIYADATFTSPTYLVGQGFHNPHFMAIAPNGNLLVSNGWGTSIVEVSDLEGAGWREFHGDARGFSAPHGICVTDEGWIVVSDNLNSRLVRFRDIDGVDFQEFADLDHQVAYIRQLQCIGNAVYASNSYEGRPGMNNGDGGSNVLKIADFDAGRALELYHAPTSNMTGLQVVGDRIYFGLWAGNKVMSVSASDGSDVTSLLFPEQLGVPYGLEQIDGKLILASFGSLDGINQGGFSELRQ